MSHPPSSPANPAPAAAPPLSDTAANDILRLAWQMRSAELQGALALSERVVRTRPDLAQAWHVSGLLLALQNDARAAIVALGRALAIEPKNLDARVALAELCIDMLDYTGAVAALEAAFAHDPDMRHPSGVRARVIAVKLEKELQARS